MFVIFQTFGREIQLIKSVEIQKKFQLTSPKMQLMNLFKKIVRPSVMICIVLGKFEVNLSKQ